MSGPKRPPLGTRVRLNNYYQDVATVVPTHWQAPGTEVDVMLHRRGTVMTVAVEGLEILDVPE